MAIKWIKQLMEVLKIGEEKIIICPGNHDLNREKITGQAPLNPKDADDLLTIEKIEGFNELFKDFIQFQENLGIHPLEIGGKKNFLIGQREILGIRFVVINSAWFAFNKNSQLWIGLPQIKVLEAANQICKPDF